MSELTSASGPGPLYVIWSDEHRAWLKPNRWGYTRQLHEAGRYGPTEAAWICTEANEYWIRHREPGLPPEVVVTAPEHEHVGPLPYQTIVDLTWQRVMDATIAAIEARDAENPATEKATSP